MTSRRLTTLLIASLALSSVTIPAIARTSSPQRTDWCSDEASPPSGLVIGREPTAAIPAPPPKSKDRRPIPVRDRWRSPHRNLSLGNPS
jgi:hypothetical protein